MNHPGARNHPPNAYSEKSIARARSWKQRRSRMLERYARQDREALEHAGQIPLVFETGLAGAELVVVSNAEPKEDTSMDAQAACFD